MRTIPLSLLQLLQVGLPSYFVVAFGQAQQVGGQALPAGAGVFQLLKLASDDAASRGNARARYVCLDADNGNLGGASQIDLFGGIVTGAIGLPVADGVNNSGSLRLRPTINNGAPLVNVAAFVGVDLQVDADAVGVLVTSDTTITMIGCDVTIEAGAQLFRVEGDATLTLQLVDTRITAQGSGSTRGLLSFGVKAADPGSRVRITATGATVIDADCLSDGTSNGKLSARVGAQVEVGPQPRWIMPNAGTPYLTRDSFPQPLALSVLSTVQLLAPVDGSLRIAGAIAIGAQAPNTNMAAGQTFTFTDGTTSEVYTAVAGAPGALQFQVGANLLATLSNLATAINANAGSLWQAQLATYAAAFHASAPWVVVARKVQDRDAYGDRVFVTGYAGASIVTNGIGPADQVNGYTGGTYQTQGRLFDFVGPTYGTIPTSDPGVQTFGPGFVGLPNMVAVQVIDTLASAPTFIGRTSSGGAGSWTSTAAYSAATPGNWAGAAPTTTKAAIDRLAAAVSGLLGAPIP